MADPQPNALSDSPAIRAKDPVTIVIFGASGDLTERKLIPALHQLERGGFMPERFAVLGISRTPLSDDAFRKKMGESLEKNLEPVESGGKAPPTETLVKTLHYLPGDNDDPALYKNLAAKLKEIEAASKLPGNRLYYLAVAPQFFPIIIKHLGEAGLIARRRGKTWTRVVIEKPFGRDLDSARKLNDDISEVLNEFQIYRIDHYLGKETVQNILSFRFGNSIFEPLFDRKYVDHVQITATEPLGMEGKRGAYYDTAGASRDMLQNHMLQLLSLVAMEPPPVMDGSSIHDAKVMLLRSLLPFTEKDAVSSVRGQYGPGTKDGQPVKGYRQEEQVAPQSITETYLALKLKIDNWRWSGVPFYLRTGKRLAARLSEIAVTFKQPPTHLFNQIPESEYCLDGKPGSPNQLVLRIQPGEGISLSFACKRPGLKMSLDEVKMDFMYNRTFKERLPEAYERLLLDALKGDQSLFTRTDEVYQAWRFVTSLHEAWVKLPPPIFPNYDPFSDGPRDAAKLFGCWRPLSEPKQDSPENSSARKNGK